MLHADPAIEKTAAEILESGVTQLTAISLTPYRCEVSTDAYEEAVSKAFKGEIDLNFVPDWNLAPGYIDALSTMLGEALYVAPPDTPVLFTAHSLPQRMIDQGDPYFDQLQATALRVAGQMELRQWSVAFQSVSAAAREPWLGPSVEEAMDKLAAEGAAALMIDPIGFVADHVETLYDNDIEHRKHADSLGIELHRCRCLNTHPKFVAALAELVLASAP
jgi:ferrochelatase